MPIVLRGILIAAALFTTYFIMKKIRQAKLQIEYSIFWLIISGILVVISIFPELVALFTRLVGIQLPVNFIFLFFIFVLLIKSFMMTIELSTLENKLKYLTQEIALMEKKRQDAAEKKEKEEKGTRAF